MKFHSFNSGVLYVKASIHPDSSIGIYIFHLEHVCATPKFFWQHEKISNLSHSLFIFFFGVALLSCKKEKKQIIILNSTTNHFAMEQNRVLWRGHKFFLPNGPLFSWYSCKCFSVTIKKIKKNLEFYHLNTDYQRSCLGLWLRELKAAVSNSRSLLGAICPCRSLTYLVREEEWTLRAWEVVGSRRGRTPL